MSIKCDKCGKLVPDGEASCPNCGTKIEMDNLAVGCLFVLGLIGFLYLIFRYWQVIILVAAVLLVAATETAAKTARNNADFRPSARSAKKQIAASAHRTPAATMPFPNDIQFILTPTLP